MSELITFILRMNKANIKWICFWIFKYRTRIKKNIQFVQHVIYAIRCLKDPVQRATDHFFVDKCIMIAVELNGLFPVKQIWAQRLFYHMASFSGTHFPISGFFTSYFLLPFVLFFLPCSHKRFFFSFFFCFIWSGLSIYGALKRHVLI